MNRSKITLLIFSMCFALTSSAQDRRPHENKNAEKRARWFQKVCEDSSITNPEYARWNAYQEAQSRQMNTPQTAAVANWQNCGPFNQAGRMISHAFDPFNSQVVWAGSASGGLWRTADLGLTWQPMTDNLPSIAIGAVAIDPQNPAVMLIGTGEGYLFSTWFAAGVGILRSTDGGVTWNPTSLTVPDSINFASLGFAWDPLNTNNVYAATTYGIFRSIDGGVNWIQALSGFVATAIVINKQSPNIIYAAAQNYPSLPGGIVRSIDNGITWQSLTNGLPAPTGFGFTSLAICDGFPNVLYMGISQPYSDPDFGRLEGFYKTSDGGNSWTQLPTSGYDFYCYPAPFDNTCQGWYDNITAVSPSDTNLVFAGGIYLYASTDGGQNWDYSDYVPTTNPPWMHPDQHSFGFSPHNNQQVWAFNDGGIHYSSNAGLTWFIMNNGVVTTQFYYVASSATNPNLAIGGTQDNGIWYNYNIGSSNWWTQFWHGDGFAVNVDHSDANTWYTTELFAGRMKSRNGGLSWDSINNGILNSTWFITPLTQHPTNPLTLFTADDNSVYRSIDSGATWLPVLNAPYMILFEFDRANPSIMYCCSDPELQNSTLYRSNDAGTTWTLLNEPGNKITDMGTDPNNSGVVYLTRSTYTPGSQLWKSIDTGNTWFNVTADFPAIPANTVAVSPHNSAHVYVGCDLGVYLTTGGGFAWSAYNTNLPNVRVQDLHYYTPDSSVRVGTHGRGYWKSPAADPSITSSGELPGSNTISPISAFPNPSTENVQISYTLTQGSDVLIEVFNPLGQRVCEVLHEEQIAGSHTVQWNGTNSRGVKVTGAYFIRVTSGKMAQTVKVLIAG
ncbi:MAG TPA: T9SS type A sorting domain-containing protein [Bacteroidia bacterium]|nr:T9SS type A sorting domain-containing protein [Bacteroidia bacterium]